MFNSKLKLQAALDDQRRNADKGLIRALRKDLDTTQRQLSAAQAIIISRVPTAPTAAVPLKSLTYRVSFVSLSGAVFSTLFDAPFMGLPGEIYKSSTNNSRACVFLSCKEIFPEEPLYRVSPGTYKKVGVVTGEFVKKHLTGL